ncbi:MAG: ABC transporter permease [Chitinophagales bacterium]
MARHKGFTLINIMGLGIGLTACILIGLFVWDEYQYDRFVPDGDRIYRVWTQYTNSTETNQLAVTPPAFASTLKIDFPEAEQSVRVMMTAKYKMLFESERKKIYEENGFFVDSNFFDLFPLRFRNGSSIKALDDPNSIVISEDLCGRLFGNENPIGKRLLVDKTAYQVRGVFVKNPKFHLQFNYLLPVAALHIPTDRMQSWVWHQFMTYVKLKKGAHPRALQAKFQSEVKKKEVNVAGVGQFSDLPMLQPLREIHLYSSSFKFDLSQRGNITYVRALTLIAAFILIIACFNFINLATAKSMQRAREVGVRKSIGALRNQLMLQFMGETILLAVMGILFALLLVALLLPSLNQFTNKQISFGLLINPLGLVLLVILVLLTGLIAGFYPAFIVSGFKPAEVLKGTMASKQRPVKMAILRHGLVIIQFSLSVLLIISAIIVFRQVNFLHNKDLGFNKDQIMFFPMRGDQMSQHSEAFKNELLGSSDISSVSIGYGYPGDAVAGDEIIVTKNGKQVTQSATQLTVDFDYIRTLGLQIIEGRDFSREMRTDQDHAWIINETAVKDLGFSTPQKAIGQTLSWHPWDAKNPDSLKTGQVIGVVKDFNYKSLYDKVETAVIQIFPGAAWKVAVKLKAGAVAGGISHVKKIWSKFSPDYPIEYSFLDDSFEQMYTAEDKLQTLLWIFTGMAIFVGCLGLFGLAAYTAERRKKEVGIRKVLGASVENLVLLLSKDFVRLVLISLFVASPIAWYFMNKWLQDFAYRINIGWWAFGLAGILALSVAFITVSFQAIKAAMANPVKSLRTE